MIKVLHIGDIVRSPGRTLFARVAHRMRNEEQVEVWRGRVLTFYT